jgi:hypothetical protein
MTETYVDAKGTEISEGDRVAMAGWPWSDANLDEHPVFTLAGKPLSEAEACGTILSISDPNVDDGDKGQPVDIPPRVTVRFDDGVEGRYTGRWLATGPWDEDAPYEFEDIEKITTEERDASH